jgi:3'-phosphoadenosine 5'-phosphosulfate sulfotransferase (PAPS reductase)/FAD synthetase
MDFCQSELTEYYPQLKAIKTDRLRETQSIDLFSYKYYVVAFSGGKDSLACILHLLEQGIDPSKIELWHHDVDGGSMNFMDWAITKSYCQAVADALKLKIYFSWKRDGFFGEMLRHESRTLPIEFESPNGLIISGGLRGKISTRMKFPMVTSNMRMRWCSSYLKIMVGEASFINQDRFRFNRTLFITGERAEESYNRAKYLAFEPYRADNRNSPNLHRLIDVWRPVHKFKREDVWKLIQKWRINPHPCYHLGWGRCSCAGCIFSSKNQWATLRQIAPVNFQKISLCEQNLQTIHPNISITQLADAGKPFDNLEPKMVKLINSTKWNLPIVLDSWESPSGVYGDNNGPT